MNARAQKALSAIGKLLTPAERRVAVDVGSRHVKIAEFRYRKEKLEVLYIDSMAIPYNSSRGDITPDRVRETLQKLLQKHNIRTGGFISLLPREFVTIKQHELPSIQRDQLKQMLQFEAEKYLPFAIDRAIIDFDFEVLEPGRVNGEEESADIPEPTSEEQKAALEAAKALARVGQKALVTMAGVRRGVIPKFLELLTVKGCRQRAIDVSSFALYNAFRYFCRTNPVEPDAGDQIVIEIGARRIEFIMISAENGRLQFTRSTNIGGDVLTEYIAGQESISFEEAEQKKCENWDTTVLANSETFDVAFQPLLAAIEKTIRYILKSSLSLKIGTVWLSGGTANVPGLSEYLQQRLDLPIRLFDPLSMLGVQSDSAPSSSFSMVAGCGLRMVGDAELQVDLLPVDITKLQLVAMRKRRIIQLSSAAAVVIVILVSILGLRVLKTTLDLKKLVAEIGEMKTETTQLTRLQKRNEALRLIVGEMEELTDRKTSWTQVMQTLAECMNSNVWIRKLRVQKNNRLELDVYSPGIEYMDFVDKLKKRIRFESVRSDSNEAKNFNKKEVQFIKITCSVLPDFKFYQKLRDLVPANMLRSKPEVVTASSVGDVTNRAAVTETGPDTNASGTGTPGTNSAGSSAAKPDEAVESDE